MKNKSSILRDASSALGALSRPYSRLCDSLEVDDVMGKMHDALPDLPPSEVKRYKILWQKAYRIAHARKRGEA